MTEILIDLEVCTGCGGCAAVCNVTQVYKMQGGKAVAVSARRCWECGQCVAVCPVDAINHSAFPLEACPQVAPFLAAEVERLSIALQSRRSVRVYKTQTVPREMVEQLIQIARSAPSAKNRQVVDWIAVDNRETIADLGWKTVTALALIAKRLRKRAEKPGVAEEELRQMLADAKSLEFLERKQDRGEDAVFFGAPVLLMAHVPPGEFGVADAVYAAYSLMLAAHIHGLGTCQIGYFSLALRHNRTLRKQVGVPKGREIVLAMVLGYPQYRYRRANPRRPHEVVWGN